MPSAFQKKCVSGAAVRLTAPVLAPLIIDELAAQGLPLELAMLSLVDSALNPHARTRVRPLGAWQFIAPTAQRFVLCSSRLVDDRKNLVAATRAGLSYLKKLHAQFGDWHLAMAAYIWGEGRVQGAADRQSAHGEAADFNALTPRMPTETRHCVPQVIAFARLVTDPAAYGATLPELPEGNPLVDAEVPADIRSSTLNPRFRLLPSGGALMNQSLARVFQDRPVV